MANSRPDIEAQGEQGGAAAADGAAGAAAVRGAGRYEIKK
jgi:hypothetical protein